MPVVEPQAMPYDVAQITKELQESYRIFKKENYKHDDVDPLGAPGLNRVTPKNVARLVTALEKLTAEVEAKRDTLSNWMPDAAIILWDNDLADWKGRLADYRARVDAAIAKDPENRSLILWDVTAPLLVGYYGGPDSKLPQQPIDAVTPFSLANQLAVDQAWREERMRRFWEDIKEAALNVGLSLLAVAGVVLAVMLAFELAKTASQRNT